MCEIGQVQHDPLEFRDELPDFILQKIADSGHQLASASHHRGVAVTVNVQRQIVSARLVRHELRPS
jgi:hypothetical protein